MWLVLLIRLILNQGASDETPVFGYVLAFQVVAIIIFVAMAGWGAFARPW